MEKQTSTLALETGTWICLDSFESDQEMEAHYRAFLTKYEEAEEPLAPMALAGWAR
jgi:hypothetical protein